MRWLWPQHVNDESSLLVRIGRLIHWLALSLAVFGLLISFFAMSQVGDTEPVPYIAVGLVWLGVAMIGRGLRYVFAKE